MKTNNRLVPWTGLALVALLAGVCAGCEPFEPRDDREEGPKGGLFSGPDGEFVIDFDVGEQDPTAEEIEEKARSEETNE